MGAQETKCNPQPPAALPQAHRSSLEKDSRILTTSCNVSVLSAEASFKNEFDSQLAKIEQGNRTLDAQILELLEINEAHQQAMFCYQSQYTQLHDVLQEQQKYIEEKAKNWSQQSERLEQKLSEVQSQLSSIKRKKIEKIEKNDKVTPLNKCLDFRVINRTVQKGKVITKEPISTNPVGLRSGGKPKFGLKERLPEARTQKWQGRVSEVRPFRADSNHLKDQSLGVQSTFIGRKDVKTKI